MSFKVYYFPAPPQRANPVVLLQNAVKLMVVVVRERLVTVDVPNDNRKRLGPTAGVSKPDSISNGITEESSDGTFATSSTGSLLLFHNYI